MKKPSKEYNEELNLLMVTIYVRCTQSFYATQLEDLLKKRLLPACQVGWCEFA